MTPRANLARPRAPARRIPWMPWPAVTVTAAVAAGTRTPEGTGGGFKRFCSGGTNLSSASPRSIKEYEKRECRQAGLEHTEFGVAIDGVSILVDPKTRFVDFPATDELMRIRAPGSKAASPSEETIISGTYSPPSRPLYVCASNRSLRETPAILEFVRLYLEGAGVLSARVGCAAPSDSSYVSRLERLDEIAGMP